MSITVDRLAAKDAVALREFPHSLRDVNQTGYRLAEQRESPVLSLTTDSADLGYMIATTHSSGSFLPVPINGNSNFLVDMLAMAWASVPQVEDWPNDEIMIMPPPMKIRMNLRIQKVSRGVPSSAAFED